MSLLWIEGFEGYGITNGIAPAPADIMARRYTMTAESSTQIVTGRYTGMAIKFTGATCAIKSPSLTTNQTMTVGVAYKTNLAAECQFLSFYDGATLGVNLRSTAAGELAIYRGSTQLAITSGLGLSASTWYYIEMKVKCASGTSGTYEVHKDGTQIGSLTSAAANTKAGTNNYHTAFALGGASSETPTFDDLYCLDASGSVNNTFIGVKQVVTIYPAGAGGSSQWIASAGSNYQCVDDDPVTDDADYVSGQTGNLDLYAYTQLGEDVLSSGIVGVQVNTECRNTGFQMNLSNQAKLSGTETSNSNQAVSSSSYMTLSRIMETDPTGATWTAANVNSTEFGVKAT